MRPLIVIAGPTACGKTNLSLLMAKKLDTQIISADSMQIYKYMDIGTAKVDLETRKEIKHYMVDEIDPGQNFSVADYQMQTKKYLDMIYSQNKIPILCGGTGFYINAILYDNDFSSEQNDFSIRDELYKLSDAQLWQKLLEIDAKSAKIIHPNNKKRIVRAIEFFYQTGQKISDHNAIQKQNELKYDALFVILTLPRQILYERIEKRVDKMIEEGLVDEVKKLLAMGYEKKLNSMQAIGYKEIISHLENEITLEQAISLIKKNTRHYAKRQLTWFRHQSNGIWIDKSNFKNDSEIGDYVLQLVNDKINSKKNTVCKIAHTVNRKTNY